MASAEAPSASSLGPRYAPEDPTLPKPWKGLIDGSTGLLYYWNPETNITQYDKPVPMNPPLPPGPPPIASAPNIASVPVVGSLPSNVSAPEQQLKQNHPVAQQPQSVCQQMPALNSQQLPYHQTQPVNQQTQQQYSQLQSNQIHYPQVSYFQGPLMGQFPVQGSQVPYKQQGVSFVPYQQGSHFSFQQQPQQQGSEVSVQQQQQLQGSQVPFQQQHQQQQHGPLASYQQQEQLQASKIPFQMGQQPQVSQTSHYQGKQPENQQIAAYQQGKQAQGQQIAANQQGQQIGFSRMEESLQQEGKQAGLSLPQVQLTGLGPSNHQLSGPVTQIQVSQGGFNSLEPQQQLFCGQSPSGQPFRSLSSRGQQFSGLSLGQQFDGPSSGAQQLSCPSSSGQHFRGLSSGGEQFSGQHVSISSVQFPQVGTDQSYQGQQMSSPIIPNQVGQSMARPMGLPIGNEEDQRGRLGNDFLPLSRNEGTMMPSQLPKLALLPQRWNAQDMRKSGVSPHFVSPANFGELNLAPGHRMPDLYNHPPFPNSAPMRPTQRMFGVPEFPAIMAADTYRQQAQHHEVTTMHVEVVPPEDKQQRLDQILRSHERGTKIIIFCSTKRQCAQLAHGIGRTFGAASIHGDKSQDERDHALNQFRCGKAPILVATDVAARGLDIKGIRVVINYDFPTAIHDYVHRIGRTERAGTTGVSYTFFSHEDWKYAADLIKVLEGANQRVPPELHEMAARGGPPAFSRTLSHGSVSRWESGGGRWESGGGGGRGSGQWESDGCRSGGIRDFGGGRGSGQWESDGGRSGGMRDFGGGRGFGGRGGSGGRNDFYGGRGSMRGRGIGGPSGYSGPGDRRRHDQGPRDRYYNHPDGQGRFDGATRREYGERGRDRSYSRSPGKVHSRGYDRGREGSRSRSRSRSLSWSRSQRRPRSWSRSRSRIRSSSRSRSRSRSYDTYDRPRRKSLFSDSPALPEEVVGGEEAPRLEAPVVPGFDDVPPLSGDLSPMSPGQDNGPFPRKEKLNLVPVAEGSLAFAAPETGLEPGN